MFELSFSEWAWAFTKYVVGVLLTIACLIGIGLAIYLTSVEGLAYILTLIPEAYLVGTTVWFWTNRETL